MPILKPRVQAGCPEPPQGNKDLSNYMVRMKEILQQLSSSHDKGTATQRMGNLQAEIIAKYPDLIVI
jgi:hypothetical protein